MLRAGLQAWIFDVDRRLKELPDTSSWFTCWLTLELPEIYTLDPGNVAGLKITKNLTYCAPGEFPKYLVRMRDKYLPIYLSKGYLIRDFRFGEVHKYCLDCRDYKVSSHIKPDFW